MNGISRTYLVLVVIVAFSFLVRTWQIGTVPRGALIDEAHFGYLAYSLLETGKDEHGVSFPLIFRGFGDNKLPLQAYLMMPVVALFGLSNATIRYPSILAGAGLVVVVFFLLKELKFKDNYSLAGALLTAISPWTFFLSRFGFESNLGLFLFSLGLLLLLKSLHQDKVLFIVGAGVSLGLTWYSYISFRPVTFLILVLLLAINFFHKRKITAEIKRLAIVFGVFLITVSPFFLPGVISANQTRFKQVGILSDQQLPLQINENRTFCDLKLPRPICDLVWNKPVVIGKELTSRFLHAYSPQFLATTGEGENQFLTINGHGQLYLVTYPLLLAGLFFITLKLDKKTTFNGKSLIILGLLLSPLPTILVGQPQQVRLSVLVPFLIVTTMIGLRGLLSSIKSKLIQKAIMLVVVGGVVFQAGGFFVDYFSIHTLKNEHHYQSYLPETFTFLNTLDESTQIVIKPFFSDPLMFYAYYNQLDPSRYQELAVLGDLEDSGFQHTVELGGVIVSNNSASYEGCRLAADNQQGVLVTNEEVSRPILYQGKSTSGVHTFIYVYDLTSKLDLKTCL